MIFKAISAVVLTMGLMGQASLFAEEIPGKYTDLVSVKEGWLSDVSFKKFGVWNADLTKDGTIELTFWASFSSGFGVPVKLDVQRVFVDASGTQHFVLRPLRIPSDEPVAGGAETIFTSSVKVTVPVGLNGPLVHLYAVTGDSITTSVTKLPAAKLK